MLNFKPHSEQDIPNRVKWLNNKAVKFALENFDHVTDLVEQEKWFKDYESNDSKKFFTIYFNDLPIGFMGLSRIDSERRSANVFILIGEDEYRGNGFGKMAMNHLIDYAFRELDLKILELDVYNQNLPAINLYKALNFKIVEEDGEFFKMELDIKFEKRIQTE